jgi:hypothetical protein
MIRDNNSDGAWFAASRPGYGTGLPIAWQGWAMMIAHIAAIAAGAAFLDSSKTAAIAWIVLAAALPLPLYAAKTRGGWKWRGTGKD